MTIANVDLSGSVTLADIEESTSRRIFVTNVSEKITGGEKAEVLFAVQRPNSNQTDTVTVPATWLPIDLCTMVSRNQLLDSSDFRRALQRGVLRLMTEESADMLLARDSAKGEQARLDEKRLATESAIRRGDGITITKDQTPNTIDLTEDASKASALPNKLSVQLQMMDADSRSDDEFISKIQSYGQLSVAALQDIADTYKERTKVVEWLIEISRNQVTAPR